MDKKTRIEKDVLLFEKNLLLLGGKKLTGSQQKTVELAIQYHKDSKYYLEKKDFFTAFGCINYAHGLLDSIIKFI